MRAASMGMVDRVHRHAADLERRSGQGPERDDLLAGLDEWPLEATASPDGPHLGTTGFEELLELP